MVRRVTFSCEFQIVDTTRMLLRNSLYKQLYDQLHWSVGIPTYNILRNSLHTQLRDNLYEVIHEELRNE
jgi:hypothetical protein